MQTEAQAPQRKRAAMLGKALNMRIPPEAHDFGHERAREQGMSFTKLFLKLLAEEARRAGIDPSWA